MKSMVERVSQKLSCFKKLMLVLSVSVLTGMTAVGYASEASPQAAPPAAQAGEVHARGDIAGDWQGTLQANKALRLILRIAKADKGWSGKMYSIDQGAQAISAN